MGWEIKVSHEEVGDQIRLIIEAGADVPDEVISSVAGSYWFEEIQFNEDAWDEIDAFDDAGDDPGGRLQG